MKNGGAAHKNRSVDGVEEPASAATQVSAPIALRARKMLDAARKVVARDGADKLTLRAVAREAGETTSLILYHFTSMERLEALLLDSLWHDIDVDFLARISTVPDDPAQRVDALVGFHTQIAQDPENFRIYFELVTNVVGSPVIRHDVAEIYRQYRQDLNYPLLAHPTRSPAQVAAYAGLVLAAGEGIPLTQILSRDPELGSKGFRLLGQLLKEDLGLVEPAAAAAAQRSALSPVAERPASLLREPIAATARRLLDAGHVLLLRGGLRALSLESISAESGEARPTVGYHFGNKQGFIDALAIDVVRRWVEAYELCLPGKRPGSAAEINAGLLGEQSPITALILVLPIVQRRPLVSELARVSADYLRDRLSVGFSGSGYAKRSIAPDIAATVFMSVLSGLALQQKYDPVNFDPRPSLAVLRTMLPFEAPPTSGPPPA